MTHWRDMMDSDYLFAADLRGKDRTVTIAKVTAGQLVGSGGKKTRKPLVYFAESSTGKPLGMNTTNCRTVATLYGNDTEGWIGKKITLYPTTTSVGGETVECIRIRPRKPSGGEEKRRVTEMQSSEREPGSDG